MFKALDMNRDGSLDFKEVMALYYVIKREDLSVEDVCFSTKIKVTPTNICLTVSWITLLLLEAKRKMAMDTRMPPPLPEEPKKKSTWLLRLLESAIGVAVGAEGATVAGSTAAADLAAEGDSCSIM
ncbi:hypothetical protein LOK49_LG06G02583 [Camellia lanceoleosa]|uniref:Uncharacterized protein n=1 Tax=Camellia lanceoleosa TaxID=1840588 RepID=A0ACC0H9N1_9ERIC|nr:hypothetical protein LOK49_LG06G02583 [Camellia lanceoleosa]